jgi:hypothetical protein
VIPASRPRNYLQAGLYVAICGVIAVMLVERLLTYAEIAEKAAVEATVGRLNSALYARLAYLALRADYDAIEALRSQSPFATADAKSAAYLGEFDAPPADAARATWHFDRRRAELVYLPRFTRHLHGADEGQAPAEVRFAVELRGPSPQSRTAVVLRAVGDWRWEP